MAVFVRVKLESEGAVSFFDICFRGLPLNSQDVVVVFFVEESSDFLTHLLLLFFAHRGGNLVLCAIINAEL